MTEQPDPSLSRRERKKLKKQQHKEERALERSKSNRARVLKRVFWFVCALGIVVGLVWWISSQESSPKGERWAKGQVHWHANIAITTCGSYRSLDNIGSTTNHVGNALLHTHGDNLYHLEGQPVYESDTTLGEFFDAIGVPFSDTKIFEYGNGDICPDGMIGVLRVTVNGLPIVNPTMYVPKDKDQISITFGKP